jgi:hypothetical protein
MYMYVYVCMHMDVYVCICMYMYVYVCKCMYMYVNVCKCMYMYVYVCMCMHVHACMYIVYSMLRKQAEGLLAVGLLMHHYLFTSFHINHLEGNMCSKHVYIIFYPQQVAPTHPTSQCLFTSCATD